VLISIFSGLGVLFLSPSMATDGERMRDQLFFTSNYLRLPAIACICDPFCREKVIDRAEAPGLSKKIFLLISDD
jgi:hypothetical protein